jgi:hypothetical protein
MSDPILNKPANSDQKNGKNIKKLIGNVCLGIALVFMIPQVRKTVFGSFGAEQLGEDLYLVVQKLVMTTFKGKPLPVMMPATNALVVPTGLTSTQMQNTWHSTPEGSDVIPVALFLALNDPTTGRPFIESMERFGFISSPTDNSGLPIGFARVKSKKHDFVLTGFNCAACHSTQITYKGKLLHIDGAPNMIDMEAFFRGIIKATDDLLKKDEHDDRSKFLLRFIYYNSLEVERLQKDNPTSTNQSSYAAENSTYKSASDESNHTLEFLKQKIKSALRITESFNDQTAAGPGRADSFGIIRNMMMTKDLLGADGNFRPMTAPVGIPHLFHFSTFTNLHWDGNTTTGNDRNYAQAIALGADFDPISKASSITPYGLYTMEKTAQNFTAPKWPGDIFGQLDTAKVARGAELFRSQSCIKCHEAESWTQLDKIGTDPNRLINYNHSVMVSGGLTETYATNLYKSALAVKRKAYIDNAVPVETRRKMDTWHEGVKPEWITTLDKGYFTRQLRGLWATAPFLHNNSVPTLWDLLQPAGKRPKKFPVGHREFDPVHVGFVDNPEKVIWELDTSVSGNHNTGHEFGTSLTDNQKWDLIEYMKSL